MSILNAVLKLCLFFRKDVPLCTSTDHSPMNIVFLSFCLCFCSMSLVSVDTVRPLTVRILTKQLPLVADRRYDVSCESAGSRPPAVITWYKGKRPLRRVRVRTCQNIKRFLTTDLALYVHILALVFFEM
jgi:hypothetical protein